MTFPGGIFLLLLTAFVVLGYYADYWLIMEAWDYRTWHIFALAVMMTWVIRNEFK